MFGVERGVVRSVFDVVRCDVVCFVIIVHHDVLY